YYLLKNNLRRHLLVKNIHSSKSIWVKIERVVGFAEVSMYDFMPNGMIFNAARNKKVSDTAFWPIFCSVI
ncbi:MAG: hypothetical protein ACFN4H_07815, partial [Prevotella sp.]